MCAVHDKALPDCACPAMARRRFLYGAHVTNVYIIACIVYGFSGRSRVFLFGFVVKTQHIVRWLGIGMAVRRGRQHVSRAKVLRNFRRTVGKRIIINHRPITSRNTITIHMLRREQFETRQRTYRILVTTLIYLPFLFIFFFRENTLYGQYAHQPPIAVTEKKSMHTSVRGVKTFCACTCAVRVKNLLHTHGQNDRMIFKIPTQCSL